ncbi:MAG: UDP-2,3-diacylglucosamine diphosphatase [Candidatus Zixiibacteriota bacterium]
MAIYFVSDAHLGAEDDKNEQVKLEKLFGFLKLVEADGQKLYILGDLFDFWFEYKHAIPKQHLKAVFKLAALAESGVEIHYITGNHDFWLGDFLQREVGIAIHRDKLEITENGLKLFLIHGDGLSPADWKYRVFVRATLRNRVAIALYRLLPPDWAIPFAKKMSSSSRNHTSGREASFVKDYEEYAKRKLTEGYDGVLIGHVHQPAYIECDKGIYINTGDFYHHFSYAKLEGKTLSLEKY